MIYIYLTLTIFLPVVLFIIYDYVGPRRIRVTPIEVFGIHCYRAKDLIVQEFAKDGTLWATRGFLIYKLESHGSHFSKVSRIPIGLSPFWLNNFRLIRWVTLRSECVEMTIKDNGHVFAFSAGHIWYAERIGEKFHKSFKLKKYGLRVGRGIMSTGILQSSEKDFFFGEYFNNKERTGVQILNYNIHDREWKTSYEFRPGQVRHIHALQEDPYTGKLWVCTGDEDHEPMIGWSDDSYTTIHPIGQGSQVWRTCQLVFTKEAIFWGTDSGSDLAGIYRWDKQNGELTLVTKTEGAVFFGTRMANDMIVMSTDREGFDNELDDKTRLFLIGNNGKVDILTCGIWNYKKSGFRLNFAKLRLQRNQGADLLAMSVLNQKELPDGELLLIHQDILSNKLAYEK